MTFPVLLDAGNKNHDAYGIRGMPVGYLLDSRGIVVWEGTVVRGKTTAAPELEKAIKELLTLVLNMEMEGDAKVGRAVALKVRIRNVSGADQTVVRALDGSDSGSRHPRFGVQIVGPDGTREDRALPARGDDLKPITPEDFVRVVPGGELDPFGSGGAPHGVLKHWVPSRSGRYTIRITVDYTERKIGHWMGTAAMKDSYLDGLEQLLSNVPPLKFESSLTIDVK